jgi:hypothetical protein
MFHGKTLLTEQGNGNHYALLMPGSARVAVFGRSRSVSRRSLLMPGSARVELSL